MSVIGTELPRFFGLIPNPFSVSVSISPNQTQPSNELLIEIGKYIAASVFASIPEKLSVWSKNPRLLVSVLKSLEAAISDTWFVSEAINNHWSRSLSQPQSIIFLDTEDGFVMQLAEIFAPSALTTIDTKF